MTENPNLPDTSVPGAPTENELDVPLALTQAVQDLKRRVTHLETLEGGAGGDWIALDKTELTSTAASITFANISQIYIALKILLIARSDRVSTGDRIDMTFNNDTGANYDWILAAISHSGNLATDEGVGDTEIESLIVADSAPANVFSTTSMLVTDYAGANHKAVEIQGTRKRANSTGNIDIVSGSGYWRDTSAITEIDLVPQIGPNFLAGSKFYLFGLQPS